MNLSLAAQHARAASRALATLPTTAKNAVLEDLALALDAHRPAVLAANEADVRAATAAGLAKPKLQRLGLSGAALDQMIAGVRQIATLPDPIGRIESDRSLANGLRVRRVRAPLGVVCMIYEARPAVTIDAFALCFKAGNACILKGGKEAARASEVLASVAHRVLERHGVPTSALTAVSVTTREELAELLTLEDSIDLVIPRGGHELIRFVSQHSRIPVIKHYQGVCHLFVDRAADLDMARRVCLTAKVSAPATCNAGECVLVHRAVADAFVPGMVAAFQQAGVEVRGDAEVCAVASRVLPATPEDFGKEFLDLIVAMRVVGSVEEALEHIARYGSKHTEAILTQDPATAEEFTRRVDASCVLVNASTRFNDGFQLGLGAEIGISTSKLHAYGPMGLDELTTTRFVVEGQGQTR